MGSPDGTLKNESPKKKKKFMATLSSKFKNPFKRKKTEDIKERPPGPEKDAEFEARANRCITVTALFSLQHPLQ